MSAVVLAEIAPRAAATGATTTVRLCWNARERANFLGQQWLPAITSLPEFETVLGYDGSRFGAGASPTVGQLQFALSADTASLAGMVWKGAAITLRRAAWRAGKVDPLDGDFSTIWSGRVDTATIESGIVTLTMLDAGDVLRRPVIDRRFGTSGVTVLDAAAAVALKGKPVPMGWGRLEGVPCLLLDAANLIYLVLGQAADSVSAFYDGGAAFTLGTARADLAALIANVPAAGRVDYCLNAGGLCLARPWTRPVYPFTADLRSGTATASAIAQALVTSRTSLGFVSGALAALTTAQSAECGFYIEDDTAIATALDRLLAGIGAIWLLTAAGQIDVRQVTSSGSSVLTVSSWTRGSIKRQRLVMPQRRFTLGYKPNWRVHSDGEIAQVLLAGDVAYTDGTPVQALQPAAAGATVGAPAGTPVAGVDASTLVTNVNAKAQTFNQASAPASPQVGWLWTVPGENAQRRWNGSAWELVLVATGSAQVQASLAVPTSGTEQVLFDQTLGVGPSGTVIVSGDLNYSPNSGLGAASVQLELAAYYRTTPGSGSWTLMGSAQAGSTATRDADIAPGEPGPVTPGAVVLSRSIAGPGSMTNWQFQIRGRILSSGGSPGGAQGSGTGRVRWS